jgi:hypothetical protein
MPLHRVFVDVGAPAGLGRHDQLAVLYARRIRDEIVLPRRVIGVFWLVRSLWCHAQDVAPCTSVLFLF